MRLRVLSDLHLEFHQFDPPEVDADVVILAGDTALGDAGIMWARERFGSVPVIYIMGNHEYYGEAYPALLDRAAGAAAGSSVHLLENRELRVGDVTFLGATLWTDFALYGDVPSSMRHAERSTDYLHIRLGGDRRPLCPADTAAIHARTLAWLGERLDALRGQRVVVVTHHAPTRRSTDPRYEGDSLTPAFVSDLEELVAASGALLWIHGHLHQDFDYMCGPTRVLCNPRGYPGETGHRFDPELVVDIG